LIFEQLGSEPRWYGRVEFLWWYLRQDDTPALVTTGPVGSTGVEGEPGVQVLYGGTLQTRHDRFIGLRPTLGYWLDAERTRGIEVSAFILERDSSLFQIEFATEQLFRPYTSAEGQAAAEQFVGVMPSGIVREGSINIYGRKEFFGEDVRGLFLLGESEVVRWYAVAGAKFLQFRNRFNVIATGYDLPERAVLHGVADHFFAHDRFYGGQLGLRAIVAQGPWSAELTLACGLGVNEQHLNIYGNRVTQTPEFKDSRPVGLLVQRTNTLDDTRWVFDAVPEVALTVGWSPTEWVRVQVGYSLLLWINAVRAADQIDAVNTNQILGEDFEGPRRPIVPWRERVFWAQGVGVGVEVRW
jgi:hypothetical protein